MDDIIRLRELLMDLLQIDTADFFFVGGLIRDMLLHRQTTDVDIAFEGDFDKTFHQLSKAYAVTASKVSTMQLTIGRYSIDFAMMRQEIYPNADGFPIVQPASPKVDMQRRDFTVNTGYALICEENIDAVCHYLSEMRPVGLEIAYAHTHFLRDLNNRVLAVLHPMSFEEDPTRLIRVIKYTVANGFKMDRKTRRFFQDSVASGAIKRLPASRLYGALLKVMVLPEWLDAAAFIAEKKVLAPWFNAALPSLDVTCAKDWEKLAPNASFYRFAVLLGDEIACFTAHFGKRVTQYLRISEAFEKLQRTEGSENIYLYKLYCQMQNMPNAVLAALGYLCARQYSAYLPLYQFIIAEGMSITAPLNGNELKQRGIMNIREAKASLMAAQLAKRYRGDGDLTDDEIEIIIAKWR
ncbi:CCA tRNA nucleotidyltransferase [Fusibacter paucivorans]|uniref:CCA tRNA nucleotidyltransferase n=1 Tax=Fusibacter paucivorans TaxID=76009 RepID=A0ABS5PP64_9FIRM|nr:hypothetical protein [Fusibacter paucivorans]MBS7526687.1 CCA tRNA nucleotidyltransferase [Fusibacter paucivorans]